ncbi:MAG: CoA-binding protein [Alphaproteobacteria bacterium]|uniref:CoA-binding protein n=1 Tax=Candidatus Nitrobium versatile TaxID=2884831 RepID=A0A953J7P6_9BACT|nr:CoA-binding protein [Candidatus Nitrobium versatile]
MNSLESLFAPESVVLIGAAHTETKLGGIVLKNLRKFPGKVYPVNPKYRELMGYKAYPSLHEVPYSAGRPLDLAVIMRPASEVADILRDLRGKVRCAIIVSSGFAEAGQKDLQDKVRAIGRESGMRLLGPNCMGIFNAYRKLDTFFIPYERLKRPKRGNTAILSQSGAVMTTLFEAIRAANTGVSVAVGYGNAVDIDEGDLYEYLRGDNTTQVVVSYIESLGDGRKFLEKARRLGEKKSLVILKAGKGEGGQTAAYSHTGRLAGRYEVFASLLRQFGIREAGDFDELIDTVKALSYQKPAPSGQKPGKRICIITNGGGAGVLAADECMRQGLEVTRVPEERIRKFREMFPSFFSVTNPVDLTAQVRDEDYLAVLDELQEVYDGFLIIALTGVIGISLRLAEMVRSFKERTGKPVALYTSNDGGARALARLMEKAGIPSYPSPERAVRGLKALFY